MIFLFNGNAQNVVDSQNQHTLKRTHRLTLGIGHTHLSQGEIEGDIKWLAVPSWTINYDFWFANMWAFGVQTDIILESFLIESNKHGELIEREYPLSIVPVFLFKPFNHLSFTAGVGGEYAKNKTLTMTRLGIEYGFHLPKNWEVGTALLWDGKWDYYNSWAIAFTFTKLWPKSF